MGLKPDTPRTSIGNQKYIHLSLKKKPSSNPIDLLFCDLSGEIFEPAVNSTEACAKILELGRIDHLSLLIDGNELRRIDTRHAAQRDARLLLRNFIDSGELSPTTPIEIIFSKIDLFDVPPPDGIGKEETALYASSEETKLFVEQVKNDIVRDFASKKLRIRFFDTVASPSSKLLGYGLEKLLPFWVEEVPPPQPRLTFTPQEFPSREIDKFTRREVFRK